MNSFAFTRSGSRQAVKAAVAGEVALPKESDQAQLNAFKAYLVAMIDLLPAEFNGVALCANGEMQPGRIVLHNATVQGQLIDL